MGRRRMTSKEKLLSALNRGDRLFWNDVRTEPKRQFRFELKFSSKSFGDGAIPVWTVKTASKPKANVSTIEHQYVDHTFKYPGRVTWDPITVTLVDPVEPDLSWGFLNVLGMAGYKYPTTATRSKLSLSRMCTAFSAKGLRQSLVWQT